MQPITAEPWWLSKGKRSVSSLKTPELGPVPSTYYPCNLEEVLTIQSLSSLICKNGMDNT